MPGGYLSLSFFLGGGFVVCFFVRALGFFVESGLPSREGEESSDELAWYSSSVASSSAGGAGSMWLLLGDSLGPSP